MRWRVVICGAVAGALALPGGASAQSWVLLRVKPVEVHGYRMTKTATQQGAARLDTLEVEFFRSRGRGWEVDDYWFSEHVRFAPQRDLSSASLTADLGQFGQVRLSFGGRHAPGALPSRCHGRIEGAAYGRGVFTLTTRSRLGTVRERFLPAALSRVDGLRCRRRGPRARAPGYTLTGSRGGGHIAFFASAPTHGAVAEEVTVEHDIPPHAALQEAIITRTLFAPAPRRDFTAARDLSAARVTGAASFLRGTLSFTATGPYVPHGRPGTEAGTLEARFDSVGTIRLAAGGGMSGWLDEF